MVPTVAIAATEQLASMALSAATQLDRLGRGKDASLEAVRKFAEALSKFPGWPHGPEMGGLSLDPISSQMFSTAASSVTKKHVADLADLMRELEVFDRQFKSLSKGLALGIGLGAATPSAHHLAMRPPTASSVARLP